MPQSFSNVIVHIIFSTKNREPLLADKILRSDLHAYLGGVLNTLDCQPHCIGGAADHVHLFHALSRTRSVAACVKETKRVSSAWVKQRDTRLAAFHWQSGYGAFSVSESQLPTVRAYIENQEEHHRHVTFQEEYRQFLDRHGIAYDERYVWD